MDLFVKIIIVVACVFLFTICFLLNKKVKEPEMSKEELEHCASCSNILCKNSKEKKEACPDEK